MAILAKRSDLSPSLSSQTPTPENQFDGTAGEAIEYADACYLAADGLIYRCVGATPADTSLVHGFAANKQREGKPITIYRNAYFAYTAESGAGAAVPGTRYYVDAATAGAINTTANGPACAVGALYGNIIVTTTWDKV
jgi:hypothetical protein